MDSSRSRCLKSTSDSVLVGSLGHVNQKSLSGGLHTPLRARRVQEDYLLD